MEIFKEKYFEEAENYVVQQLKKDHPVIKVLDNTGTNVNQIAWSTLEVEQAYLAGIKKGLSIGNKRK